VSSTAGVVAGWYPDPEDPGRWRYWDGLRWTEHRSAPSPDRPWERPAWVKIVIASLIALTSVLGAVGAWRASLASAEASDSDRKGFADALAAEQQRTSIHSSLDAEFTRYLRGQLFTALAEELYEQAEDASPADRARLEVEASNYQSLGDLKLETTNPDALRPDGSLDLDRAFEIEWAQQASQNDLDPEPEFAEADELNERSERLVGITALLIAAALFFTFAQVVAGRVFVVYLAGGAAVLILSTVLLVALEFT
jgi:hypothetical protein